MFLVKEKNEKEDKIINALYIIATVGYFIWTSPIWFYVLAVLLFSLLFARKPKPSKRQIGNNFVALVFLISLVYITEKYIFSRIF
jgi:membrane protein YdbS with pleckstrin-like domain